MVDILTTGREELVDGKLNLFEQLAGIIRRRNTFRECHSITN